jgi:hypothetical protein
LTDALSEEQEHVSTMQSHFGKVHGGQVYSAKAQSEFDKKKHLAEIGSSQNEPMTPLETEGEKKSHHVKYRHGGIVHRGVHPDLSSNISSSQTKDDTGIRVTPEQVSYS